MEIKTELNIKDVLYSVQYNTITKFTIEQIDIKVKTQDDINIIYWISKKGNSGCEQLILSINTLINNAYYNQRDDTYIFESKEDAKKFLVNKIMDM